MSAYDNRARVMGRRKRLSYKHSNHGRTESHWCGNLECKPSFALSRGFVRSAAIITPKNRTPIPVAKLFIDCDRSVAKPAAAR